MTVEEISEALRTASDEGRRMRLFGAGTKCGGGDLSARGLDRVLEHNEGDFTAVLEAGIALADAQARFGAAGQMLAWDPPHPAATIGGVVASADSGPLRHRYGGVRDLVVGMTVVLSDGTIATSGGKVIKNVAGYDLAKLFAGSEGTLGMVASVAVRLHPAPTSATSVAGATEDADALGRAAVALAQAPLEADCLDARWEDGSGELLVRFSGAAADRQAAGVAERLAALGLEPRAADETIWARQREAQAGRVKVPYLPADLPRVIRRAGSVVARAGLGLAWVPPGTLDLPAIDPGANAVMRRLKARFDPAGILV